MAEQILPFLWIGVALMSIVVLVLLSMTLWELRKTVKSVAIISERVAYLTDVKAWWGFLTTLVRRKG
ncbi:MAG: hypothetical protein M0P04_02945 [Syntrophales bacterium]|jgi:divalent metal cation (Fe/Co/Zn/Cd) transporter|nr:hypothetical protein [Syntrophales bacterium]MDD4338391.1 hypothetical protein [Syntrophales bacterium]HOG06819.1 hypothetical protein [Syntrophales bacterium]HOS78450.1 hypothetical protein [Syntrophales bacterium]HPB70181.1 hypothetical protein [Syntrophales bacterium]